MFKRGDSNENIQLELAQKREKDNQCRSNEENRKISHKEEQKSTKKEDIARLKNTKFGKKMKSLSKATKREKNFISDTFKINDSTIVKKRTIMSWCNCVK